jgi:hypothetical protein
VLFSVLSAKIESPRGPCPPGFRMTKGLIAVQGQDAGLARILLGEC